MWRWEDFYTKIDSNIVCNVKLNFCRNLLNCISQPLILGWKTERGTLNCFDCVNCGEMQTAAGAESLQESFELHLSTSHLRMENWVSRNNSIVLIQPANPMCLDLDFEIACDQTILTSKVCHGWLSLRELGSITTNLNGHQDQRAWLVLCRVDNYTRP